MHASLAHRGNAVGRVPHRRDELLPVDAVNRVLHLEHLAELLILPLQEPDVVTLVLVRRRGGIGGLETLETWIGHIGGLQADRQNVNVLNVGTIKQ